MLVRVSVMLYDINKQCMFSLIDRKAGLIVFSIEWMTMAVGNGNLTGVCLDERTSLEM